ncbi:uncharacterized protein FTJAE_637 [Fusarium tjaetaba]|uniref:Uncharacterized protein n=1 Tax=Fusarium tjaetaba TaxID=1567544 RepID=A0A8H5SFR9_9HYPO|nr:uncharacterized protein FTJAE_637 [Fusarium tjaetaba]KAF5650213.1 hypothetical protein FTJAE_637 [Fusarium tjaetaba]
MARGLSNSCSSDGDDHFISVMRLFNENKEHVNDRRISFPRWIEKYCDYSHTKHAQAGVHDLSDPNLEVQRKMGILSNKVWTVEMKDPNQLAQYCAFKTIRDLSSYVDVIVPDIVYQAAFVTQNYFLVPQSYFNRNDVGSSSQNLIEPLNTQFRDYQRQLRYENRMMDIDVMDPMKVLRAFHSDGKVRRFINDVAKLCTKPTFIPVLNQTVSTPGEPGKISPCAFILAHAVQILLFAPQDWDSGRVYTRDQGAYAHRFPTPETIGGGTTPAVAGPFSMEDLHRAVLLFYYLLKRRSASKWITRTAPQSSSNAEFPGYHCPASPTMNQDQFEVAPAPLSNEEPANLMAKPQPDQPATLADADAPEALDEPQPIRGLNTIKINTMFIESATTTRPRRSVAERQRKLRKPEMHPLLEWELKAEVACAKELHAQPDFDKLFARSRETETRVAFSLEGPGIAALLVDSRPGTGDISPTIIIEEYDFRDENPTACLVAEIKPKVSGQLYNQTDKEMLEHRKALLACFDWRNNSGLKSSTPFFPGTPSNAKSVIERLSDPNVPRSQIEDDTNPDVITTVNLYDTVCDDESCGVDLFYMQNQLDRSVKALGSRDIAIGWLVYQSPIMTRALDLAIKYCKDNKERLIVYVEDSWIQCVLVGLFVTAGFDVGTVRTSDGPAETDRIIREWNSPQSGLEIFVANVYAKVMHADMQKCCCKALILDWPLEPERLLQTINHMVKNRLNRREPAMVHMLKLRWSHHDEVERICCTKWAMQLSRDINLPEWMTGAVREVCIFEMIKTAWHQEFNRYSWVVMHDMGGRNYDGSLISYSDDIVPRLGHVFSIAAKLILNFPQDKEFWACSEEILVAGCYRFLKVIDADVGKKGTDRLEVKLSYTPERLRENCLSAFEHAMGFINHQLEYGYGYGDEGYHERNDQLLLGVEARARGEVSAWPDDVESQVEEQDTGVDAEMDGDEEPEQADETGVKRKADDDAESGAKKQKISAA